MPAFAGMTAEFRTSICVELYLANPSPKQIPATCGIAQGIPLVVLDGIGPVVDTSIQFLWCSWASERKPGFFGSSLRNSTSGFVPAVPMITVQTAAERLKSDEDWLEVDAMTQPMMVQKDQEPFGVPRK